MDPPDAQVRRFFDLVDADRYDDARRLVAGSVITFPLYRAEQPVIRGAAPLMERIRALREAGVVFAYDDVEALEGGYVLAVGTIGPPGDGEASIMLIRVANGCIVTVEAHQSVEDARRTVRGLGPR